MWTVLLTARDPVGPEARAAREAVCAAYWRPICAYLSALGLSKEDAEDATQTLLADFTNGGAIGRVDPAKGRLRHFLKAAARHALYNHRRAAKAVRRGGGQADLSLGSSAMSAMNDSLCPKCRTPQPLGNIGGMCPGCLALGGELDWLSAPQPVAFPGSGKGCICTTKITFGHPPGKTKVH